MIGSTRGGSRCLVYLSRYFFGYRVHLKLWQRGVLGYLTVFAFGVTPWVYFRFRFHGWRPFVVLGDELVWPRWANPDEAA